ncbi:MAG: glucose-6-phosphate isomerase [Pseudomonadota bacterium]
MNPTQTQAWQNLTTHAQRLQQLSIQKLLGDKDRNSHLRRDLAGCHFDFSKQKIDLEALQSLVALSHDCRLAQRTAAMFAGERINTSEDRAVLHAALRHPEFAEPGIASVVRDTLDEMAALTNALRDASYRGFSGKAITDIVHIGIGGSHLGPELAVEALREFAHPVLRLHFVANIDGQALRHALADLNPETTLFVVVSKSWSTLETRVNASSARSWFLERTTNLEALATHFIGITTNLAAAAEFGLTRTLPLWDWVGGRYSLWSAVGFPIMASIGARAFHEFLDGAHQVDEHFRTHWEGQLSNNIPALQGLLQTWNYNFFGINSLAVLSYDERLRLLPDYLQQLEMESNGKRVNLDGETVDYHTMPILWGGVGTNGQHAYHQLLHQGTRAYTADFILVGTDPTGLPEHHAALQANALGQSQAMAIGIATPGEPHREVPGNHPSTTIIIDALGPRQLGALLASYEHKVFTQGALWHINSFDQWGVELGKNLAVPIQSVLTNTGTRSAENFDDSTASLIERLQP